MICTQDMPGRRALQISGTDDTPLWEQCASPGFLYLALLLFVVAIGTSIGFHSLDQRKKKQALSFTASEKHSEMMERGETSLPGGQESHQYRLITESLRLMRLHRTTHQHGFHACRLWQPQQDALLLRTPQLSLPPSPSLTTSPDRRLSSRAASTPDHHSDAMSGLLLAGLQINVLHQPAATQFFGVTVPAGVSSGQTICVQMPSGEEATGACFCLFCQR